MGVSNGNDRELMSETDTRHELEGEKGKEGERGERRGREREWQRLVGLHYLLEAHPNNLTILTLQSGTIGNKVEFGGSRTWWGC